MPNLWKKCFRRYKDRHSHKTEDNRQDNNNVQPISAQSQSVGLPHLSSQRVYSRNLPTYADYGRHHAHENYNCVRIDSTAAAALTSSADSNTNMDNQFVLTQAEISPELAEWRDFPNSVQRRFVTNFVHGRRRRRPRDPGDSMPSGNSPFQSVVPQTTASFPFRPFVRDSNSGQTVASVPDEDNMLPVNSLDMLNFARGAYENQVATAPSGYPRIVANPVSPHIASVSPPTSSIHSSAFQIDAGHEHRQLTAAQPLLFSYPSGTGSSSGSSTIHSRVEYVHFFVPDLDEIYALSCYMGAIDRFKAEELLANKPEGTFLLRDSAQEDFLFSVSFRRYNRTLHARIEHEGHLFTFDAREPCAIKEPSITALISRFKNPFDCMFFEPLLVHPLPRCDPFSLQQLARAKITSTFSYDNLLSSPSIPAKIKAYCSVYHYKLRAKALKIETMIF